MNPELTDMLQHILSPGFNVDQLDLETCAGLAVLLMENRELYQKVLGKIASTVGKKYGDKKIDDLAKDIEEASGYKVSPSSLRVYRWVYQKLQPVMDKIPADYTYTTWKHLASTDDPEKWLQRGIDEGLSGAQLTREIRLITGGKTKEKFVKCPECGRKIDL